MTTILDQNPFSNLHQRCILVSLSLSLSLSFDTDSNTPNIMSLYVPWANQQDHPFEPRVDTTSASSSCSAYDDDEPIEVHSIHEDGYSDQQIDDSIYASSDKAEFDPTFDLSLQDGDEEDLVAANAIAIDGTPDICARSTTEDAASSPPTTPAQLQRSRRSRIGRIACLAMGLASLGLLAANMVLPEGVASTAPFVLASVFFLFVFCLGLVSCTAC